MSRSIIKSRNIHIRRPGVAFQAHAAVSADKQRLRAEGELGPARQLMKISFLETMSGDILSTWIVKLGTYYPVYYLRTVSNMHNDLDIVN